MTRKLSIFLLTFLCTTTVHAQEMLVELTTNARLANYEETMRSESSSARAAGDTLDLPFFDDFSEPFSRLNNPGDLYPDDALWSDDKVYVNNHMAINPISQGVATFDGLDEYGQAYGFGFALATPSDSLTSKPINLASAADTVYLSFFYQPQGLGNAPEAQDSLLLEFKDTADVWTSVWSAEGQILEVFDFERAMVPVLGGEYLYDGFQLRFRNYASLAGSADHWHLDYVRLDEGRTLGDTLIDDVSFMAQTSYSAGNEFVNQSNSLLQEYNSMPWIHYATGDTTEFMLDTLQFELRNNTDTTEHVRFVYNIYDENTILDYSSTETGTDVFGGIVCGSVLQDCNNDSSANFRNSLDGYFYPHVDPLTSDSAFFAVEYLRPDLIPDAVETNDRHVFKQKFYNYYAYDDGTAEVGYGLGNLESVGKVAMKYSIKKLGDTLRGIQLYLNPVAEDLSQEPVNLAIWTGIDEPTNLIWTSPEMNLSYSGGINYFYNYDLDTVLKVLDEIIWVGWIQQPAQGVKFSVGFDKRTDVSEKLFYNLGTVWAQSSIPGAVMIRPTFGAEYDWVADVGENRVEDLHVYPNPTTGMLHIRESHAGQLTDCSISIFDLTGREVHSETGYETGLNIGFLRSGMYILRVRTETGNSMTQRIVLRP